MGQDQIEIDFKGLEIGCTLKQLEDLHVDAVKAQAMLNLLKGLIEQIDKIDLEFIEETAEHITGEGIFQDCSFEAYFADIHDPVNTIASVFESWDKNIERLLEKKKAGKTSKLSAAGLLGLKKTKKKKK